MGKREEPIAWPLSSCREGGRLAHRPCGRSGQAAYTQVHHRDLLLCTRLLLWIVTDDCGPLMLGLSCLGSTGSVRGCFLLLQRDAGGQRVSYSLQPPSSVAAGAVHLIVHRLRVWSGEVERDAEGERSSNRSCAQPC